MASDAEHLFICLGTLFKSCLEMCLFKSFAHFLIGFFVFLEWIHMNSLYILEIKHLSKVSLANMFPYTLGSLFILILFSSPVQELFYFGEIPFVYSFFYVPCSRGHTSENIAARNI